MDIFSYFMLFGGIGLFLYGMKYLGASLEHMAGSRLEKTLEKLTNNRLKGLLLGIFVSIYWMLIGSVIVGMISYWLNAYYSGPFLDYSVKDQIVDILPSFGVSLFVGLIVYVISFIPITPYILFPVQIVVGFMLTFLICKKIKLPEFVEITGIVVNYWNTIRKAKR